MIQLLVYSVLARQGRWTVLAVWAALAFVVTVGLMQDTLLALVTTVVAADAVLLVLLLGATVYVLREEDSRVEEHAPAT